MGERRSSSYYESLLRYLIDPIEAANYLKAAAEDSPEALIVARDHVSQAQGFEGAGAIAMPYRGGIDPWNGQS